MNTKELANILLWTLNRVSETIEYESWSDNFAREQNKEAFDGFRKEVNKIIKWDELTEEDCKLLRFGKWSDDSPLRLIPLCFLRCLPKGMELTCIDGSKAVVGKDRIDNDVRCGCIAYGIIPKG